MRASFGSQFTYILTIAGATIGFGAIWRFPYLVWENGGGAYVLLFCIAMLFIGIPMILVENVIGRRTHCNSIDCFSGSVNGKKIHRFWKITGILGALGSFGIMAFYMVLAGRVLSFLVGVFSGGLDMSNPLSLEQTQAFYVQNVENAALRVALFTALFVGVNWFILARGVIGGIERVASLLMPLLFLFFALIIARNLTLDGAMEGIRFYLYSDFSKLSAKLFIEVLGQVFFALSLGFGVVITLSSFLDKKEHLLKVASLTGVINTLIALLAGFMIFPAIYSVGGTPSFGADLVFKSLPIAFSQMHFGVIVAAGFFLLLLIAALTTTLPIYEVIITILQEKLKFSRQKSIAITLLGIFVLGNIPCVLSQDIFDSFNWVSGNILFVLTGLLCALFVGWILKSEARRELSNDKDIKSVFVVAWFYYVKFIVPLVIVAIFVSNFIFRGL